MCKPGESCDDAKLKTINAETDGLVAALTELHVSKEKGTEALYRATLGSFQRAVETIMSLGDELSTSQKKKVSRTLNDVTVLLLMMGTHLEEGADLPDDADYWKKLGALSVEAMTKAAADAKVEEAKAGGARFIDGDNIPADVPAEVREAIEGLREILKRGRREARTTSTDDRPN